MSQAGRRHRVKVAAGNNSLIIGTVAIGQISELVIPALRAQPEGLGVDAVGRYFLPIHRKQRPYGDANLIIGGILVGEDDLL